MRTNEAIRKQDRADRNRADRQPQFQNGSQTAGHTHTKQVPCSKLIFSYFRCASTIGACHQQKWPRACGLFLNYQDSSLFVQR